MSTIAQDRAIVAEFHKAASGRLTLWAMTVIQGNRYHVYDVEHSRAYGYIYDMSGFGGSEPVKVSGPYTVSGKVKVKEEPTTLVDPNDKPPWRGKKTKAIRDRNRTRRLRAVPRSFALEPGDDLIDWLARNAIEGPAIHCSECRDCFPEDSLCEHTWWCGKSAWWSTPSERCGCADLDACRDQ